MSLSRSILIFQLFFLSLVLFGQSFVDVESGGLTYTMVDREGVETLYDIRVDDFRIAATEVTVAQWREFTRETGLDFPWKHHYAGDISELSPGENCPIQLVRIEEALYYCNWLSRKEGLQMVYLQNGIRIIRDEDADGYRLPTTEEWDYAARGGRFTHGYIYAGSDNPEEVAWINLPVEEGTKPVGTKAPNELGIYDMSGNIREWTWPEAGIPYPPEGSHESVHLRGGGWTSKGKIARLDYDRVEWVFQWSCNGFRLARNAAGR